MSKKTVARVSGTLVYAIKNGHSVHVSEVERGLNCGCTCPVCGERLIARKGEELGWHFAHESGGECASAPETALHRLAKDIFLEAGSMAVPELRARFGSTIYMVSPESRSRVSNVKTEVDYGEVRPDIVLDLDGNLCFVEIYVTHAVDEEKLAKLKKLGAAVLEVDLSDVPRDIPKDVLRRMLLYSTRLLRWLYNPKVDVFVHEKERQRAEAVRRRDEEIQRRKEEERQRAAEVKAHSILDRTQLGVDDIVSRELIQIRNAFLERKQQEELKRKQEEWFERLKVEAAWEARTGVIIKRKLEFGKPTPAEVFEFLACEAGVFDYLMQFFDERRIMREVVEEQAKIWDQMTPQDRLLSVHRCYRCGGNLVSFPWIKGVDGNPLYICSDCGEVWTIGEDHCLGVNFVPVEMVLCPVCGSNMTCSRNGWSLEWHCNACPNEHMTVRRRA